MVVAFAAGGIVAVASGPFADGVASVAFVAVAASTWVLTLAAVVAVAAYAVAAGHLVVALAVVTSAPVLVGQGSLVFVASRGDHLLDLEYYRQRCLLYTSPSPRDRQKSRMPSSA